MKQFIKIVRLYMAGIAVRPYLKLIGSVILLALIVIGGLFLIKAHSFDLFEKHRRDFKEPALSVLSPLKNDVIEESLFIEKAGKVSLKLWAESYVGLITLSLQDPHGVVILHRSGRSLDFEIPQKVARGEYRLRLQFQRVFPALAIMQATDDAAHPAGCRIIPYLDKRFYTRVPPDAGKGFYWPYYVYLPPSVQLPKKAAFARKYLLVMPNNTGTTSDHLLLHETAAVELLTGSGAAFAAKLGVPLLVPVFPRPRKYGNIYTHALDRDSLLTEVKELKRIDLQLIAMIDDARARLRHKKVKCATKVWMSGFSASAMFTNRFAVLHPERIEAAAVGSPGGWPIVPLAEYQGRKLRYPIGIGDLEQLTGQKFARTRFQKIPLYFYIGNLDTNDSVPFDDSYDAADRPVINDQFGKSPLARWPAAERIYHRQHCAARFLVYPLAGHEVTSKMTQDVVDFFRKNTDKRMARK